MNHYTLRITTIRHLNEAEYKAFKETEGATDVDWDELEKYGMLIERTDDEENVKSILELSITDMGEKG